MGKGRSSAPAAPDPRETAAAEAQYNRLDTYSPSGSGQVYGYTDPRTGGFVRGVAPAGAQSAVASYEGATDRQIRQTLEPASVQLVGRMVNDNITNMPNSARVQDRGTVGQSIFDRTLSMAMPGIERANSRLLTNLQARGIPIGSEAFNETYGNQVQQTQDTISRLAMDADIASGQEQSRQFGLDSSQRQQSIAEIVAAMGGNYSPPSSGPSGNAAGVNYSGLVGQQYQQQLAQHNANQQASAQTAGALGSLGGAMLMKSDRRLKRDIRKIGRRCGLNLYEYRYVCDSVGTVRRGFMAQEVLNLFPQAVRWIAGGFMALDYSQLPEVQ